LKRIPDNLTKYSTLARSPYVSPIVVATARAIHQEMDVKRNTPQLPAELRRILDARSDFYPVSPSGQPGRLREETWMLVTAILEHLSKVVFGIRLRPGDHLSHQAIRQRCGDYNRDIARVLRP